MKYFIDVQGTLIDDIDKKPINGALEFIRKLNNEKISYLVVTNNTKKRSEEFYKFLIGLGFDIPKNCYLDPFMVLKNSLHVRRVASFGGSDFRSVLESLGYEIDFKNPEAILITSSKDFGSNEFASMIELVLSGAKLVGMHSTSIYSKDGRRYAGVGAILRMISYATGSSFEIIGKPSEAFYKEGLKLVGAKDFSEIEMISDDAIGDLCGIKELGAKTTLVLSGKCKGEDEVLHVRKKLDRVLKDIGNM
jgi:NagD protein